MSFASAHHTLITGILPKTVLSILVILHVMPIIVYIYLNIGQSGFLGYQELYFFMKFSIVVILLIEAVRDFVEFHGCIFMESKFKLRISVWRQT